MRVRFHCGLSGPEHNRRTRKVGFERTMLSKFTEKDIRDFVRKVDEFHAKLPPLDDYLLLEVFLSENRDGLNRRESNSARKVAEQVYGEMAQGKGFESGVRARKSYGLRTGLNVMPLHFGWEVRYFCLSLPTILLVISKLLAVVDSFATIVVCLRSRMLGERIDLNECQRALLPISKSLSVVSYFLRSV